MLSFTGQLSAAFFIITQSFCVQLLKLPWISIKTVCTRLGCDDIVLVTLARSPSIEISFSCAAMPIIVNMHMAKEVHNKSVGEKASPFPLLSTGASLVIVMPLCE